MSKAGWLIGGLLIGTAAAISIAANTSAQKVKSAVIAGGLLYYSGITGNYWQNFNSGDGIPAKIPVSIAIEWANQSPNTEVGVVNLTCDGTALSDTAFNSQSASPGNGFLVEFNPVTIATGTHSFVATVSVDGIIQDTVKFTLIAS